LTHETISGRGEGRHYFDDGARALNNRDGLGLAEGSNKISDTRLSGNIGLNYTLADTTLLYASYSNGFAAGFYQFYDSPQARILIFGRFIDAI